MREAYTYVKKIFFDKDQALSQRDYVTIISVFWVIGSFAIVNFLQQVLVNVYALKMKGNEFLGGYSIFSSFSSVAFPTYIPWSFVILVLSIALAYKLYNIENKIRIKTVGIGFLFFIFFNILPLLPFFFLKIKDFYSTQFYGDIENDVLWFKIFVFTLATIGGILFFKSMLNSKTSVTFSDLGSGSGFSRGKFSRSVLKLQLSSWVVTGIFIFYVFTTNVRNIGKFLSILLSIFSLVITIIHIYIIVKRLVNMGKSPFLIFLSMLFGVLIMGCTYLILFAESIFIIFLLNKLIGLTLFISCICYVLLLIYPSVEVEDTINDIAGNQG